MMKTDLSNLPERNIQRLYFPNDCEISQSVKSLIANHLQSGQGIITISTEDLAGIFKDARKIGARSETVEISKANSALAGMFQDLRQTIRPLPPRYVLLQIEMSISNPLSAAAISNIIAPFSQQLVTPPLSFLWGASQRTEVEENQVCLSLVLVS